MRILTCLLLLGVAGCYPYTPPVAAGLKVSGQKGVFGGGMSLETGSDAAVKIENVKWHRDENIIEVGLAEAGLDTTTPLKTQMELAPALFAATAALDAQRADNIALVINALGDQPAKAIGVLRAMYGGRSQLAFARQGLPENAGQPFPGTAEEVEALAAATAENAAAVKLLAEQGVAQGAKLDVLAEKVDVLHDRVFAAPPVELAPEPVNE